MAVLARIQAPDSNFSMICSSPGIVIANVETVGASLTVWLLSGLLAWTGASSFAELGSAIPLNGGAQAYLSYAYGPLVSYLFAWTAIIALKPEYINRLFWSHFREEVSPDEIPQWAIKLTAIGAVAVVTIICVASRQLGSRAAVVFTVVKVASLIAITILGIIQLARGKASTAFRQSLFEGTNTSPSSWSLALYSGLWAFDGWDQANYVGGEMTHPEKNIPKAIHSSMAVVTLMFMLANLAYFVVLDPITVSKSNTVALDFGRALFGPIGGMVFAFMVAFSCFGALNGAFFTTSRLIYAAGKERFLPAFFGRLHASRKTPLNAALLQSAITITFIMAGGGFRSLINFAVVASWAFYFLTVLGLIILRVKEPSLERPYKTWIITPIIFCAVALFLLIMPIIAAPVEALAVLGFVLAGIPVFYLTRRSEADQPQIFLPNMLITHAQEEHTYQFDVKMTCSGCSGAVSRVLKKAQDEGVVSDYTVTLETQQVIVKGTLPYDDVLARIKKTGKQALRRFSSLLSTPRGSLGMSTESKILVPDGFTLHTENTSHILLEANAAFLNPVQEFNRDTSVACIRVWSEELNKSKQEKRRQNQEKKAKKQEERDAKRRKVESETPQEVQDPATSENNSAKSEIPCPATKAPEPYKFVLLEALSATGLRSIRYAKEIPLLKHVIANDLSPSATEAMRRNVQINDLEPAEPSGEKVIVNEGDACTLMYSHREEKDRVDVVDLDPYGTAAPFIDAAIQCIKDEGRVVEKATAAGNINYSFKIQNGPGISERCPECESTLHMAGPMWSGPLHDTGFVTKVLEHLEANQDKYGTAVRMKGMLTVAQEELPVPFYFTPAKVASFFHCVTPTLEDVASALLHAGHKISRSHACAGSLKTTATRDIVHNVYRSWVKKNPVKMDNVAEKSPTRRLLAKEPSFEANFKKHPDSVTPSGKMKLVRYQENPTSHWGPGTKAAGGSKRKRTKED
ncbi:hypothetical protein H0H92_010956 [Tricholoma furcatifolium]|nr:hypothetical protein H0H92_010956 [Tricholoma furcatifolium]